MPDINLRRFLFLLTILHALVFACPARRLDREQAGVLEDVERIQSCAHPALAVYQAFLFQFVRELYRHRQMRRL